MYKLARHVRFSVNPFLDEQSVGANSYSARPCGEGLCLYFGLWVELVGPVDPDTGFVINVVEVDRAVRQFVVPVFVERIKQRYGRAEFMPLSELCEILRVCWPILAGCFTPPTPITPITPITLTRLSLELNPARRLTIDSEDCEMARFSEKFDFAAMHTLWNDKFSDEKNLEVFGKCANPTGHGHNYVVEVTIQYPSQTDSWNICGFQHVVDKEFISIVDHKNLNVDVPEFEKTIPTMENIARFAWDRLYGRFGGIGGQRLLEVTIWETDKTCCTYCGP